MELIYSLPLNLLITILPAIVLFLFGIEQFSKEILKVSGDLFRTTVQKMAKTPLRGVLSGTIVTAIVQSSTATTLIAVSLVNSGLLSFPQSIGIILGSNIGTAITAQLVALKLITFAPIFMIVGFVVDIVGGKYKFIGKPLFYFGLVFFSLMLISDAVSGLKDEPRVLNLFSHFSNPLIGIFVGFIITNIFMSSSVTTGLTVIFAQAGLLGFSDALLLVLGANIGTTVTTVIASWRMDLFARRSAMAHFLFNVLGVLLLLPFLPQFTGFIEGLGGNEGQMIANAHMAFNITAAAVFLLFISWFEMLVRKLVPGDEKQIILQPKYLNSKLPKDNAKAFDLIEKEVMHSLDVAVDMHDEVMRAIEMKIDCRDRIDKMEAYSDLLDDEISMALLVISKRAQSKEDTERAVMLTRISNQIEQIADLAKILSNNYCNLRDRGIYLSEDSLAALLSNYVIVRQNFRLLQQGFDKIDEKMVAAMRKNDDKLRACITSAYKEHMKKMQQKQSNYGSLFVEMLSALDNTNDHVRNIRKILY